MTRVLISAPSPVMRAGLASLLREDPSLEVTADPGDDSPLAVSISPAAPDVIVIVVDPHEDVDSPEPTPPDSARADESDSARTPSFRESDRGTQAPRPAWVILADNLEDARAAAGVPPGLHSILPRDAEASEIRAAIHAAAAGLIALRPEDAEELIAPSARRSFAGEGAPGMKTLTARETEVLRMLAEGLGNKEIAWKLKISEHTVKFHISSIFTKLDVSSRTEAVTAGIRLGVVMV
ncbi:MAG: response regulator transcription factor [Acidobacteriota bacterium]|nr:response regulator transcription factor [Acidobacteriota bacterium]